MKSLEWISYETTIQNTEEMAAAQMDFEPEIVEIDAETEDLAYFLTLLIKTINPKIQCGSTYEILISILLKAQEGPIEDGEAVSFGEMILKSQFFKTENRH